MAYPAPIFLGDVTKPSQAGDYPAVKLAAGGWSELSLSSGDVNLPVAAINGCTPETGSTWDGVKSLFR